MVVLFVGWNIGCLLSVCGCLELFGLWLIALIVDVDVWFDYSCWLVVWLVLFVYLNGLCAVDYCLLFVVTAC